jgi:hypothetical protein
MEASLGEAEEEKVNLLLVGIHSLRGCPSLL